MSKIAVTNSEENTLKDKGYKLDKLIGEGAYAKVYLTTFDKDEHKQSLACKVIETSKAPRDFVTKFLPREIDVLVRLNHPHIIHIHSIYQRKTKYYIFMRNAENGDLLTYILKRGAVSENQARVWFRQLALALQYLHELEIAHRDIKCENVLLTANYNVKLSDFGFSRYCVDDDERRVLSETYCGSMSYAAPEILRGKPYHPKPTDLWSLGVILFVMLNKSMPFDNARMRKLYEQQMRRKYRFRSRVAGVVSSECRTVVRNTLEPDPGLRHSAAQVLASDWIAMDSRLKGLNPVEERAIKKAKEERVKFQLRSKPKKQGSILPTKTHERYSSFRILNSQEKNVLKLTESEQSTLWSRGYKIIKKINEGSYSKVYLAEYKNSFKRNKAKVLACKVIDTNVAPSDFVEKFLPREINLLTKLSHPHLVPAHSIFERNKKYFIFMRYMERGDLLDYIVRHGAVPEQQARVWTRQLALAVQYLHELEVAHRDIKCENVLLSANYNAKLTDFSFSRSCVDGDSNPVYSDTFCGSVSYTAPEILQGEPYCPKPTDVWSLGVVLYVMLNQAMPFDGQRVRAILRAQIDRNWKFNPYFEFTISNRCKRMVTLMLEPNPRLRITAEEVARSKWILMDPRLVEWNLNETIAYNKARQEKANFIRKALKVQQTIEANIGSKL
ncbi:testis-specific serine/threonine-protein kinase 1-like [Aricia agestis]|uniref:testis-specific serine/threonine-protein kinase 1-like n=1 Tax=Aricia agestis TaxID=91739 RepID=UPI001C205B2C|nr:testis-specific serine/threonine-protein kinase 1-like [Aricia agestis]